MKRRAFGGSVDLLDADGLAEAIEEAAKEAANRAAIELTELHRQSLLAGRSPDGGMQKQNAQATQAEKSGKMPLIDTGELLRGVRVRQTKDGADVLPPASRVDALDDLHDQGYETIFNLPARDVEEIAGEETAKAVDRVDVDDHVRRRKI